MKRQLPYQATGVAPGKTAILASSPAELRLLKLTRYSQALRRFTGAVLRAKKKQVLFTLASVILLYLVAGGIYYFEHPAQLRAFGSIFDCFWWAVATLTTVSYGDFYPITVAGRLFYVCGPDSRHDSNR
ncbi:potassium channel family protein [Marinobacter bohaiensis]|uniref:potassium channel family protein n=1 Tax=Marinobacter bohaiensis TaxID=2201898 RepID=UPI0013A6FF89|nr:potassium channel family protein [Marinobacter bohaiensis]